MFKIDGPLDGDTTNGPAQPTLMGDASKRAARFLAKLKLNGNIFLQLSTVLFAAALYSMDRGFV